MLPWGHAAVGYLLYTAFTRMHRDETPQGLPVIALALGTQLPDLVDKPIGWYFEFALIPTGRSLGHSLLTTTVLLVVIYGLTHRVNYRDITNAFSIGLLSHLAADALYPLIQGTWTALAFLAWPLVEQPTSTGQYRILGMLINGIQSPRGLFELGLFLLATGLWLRHQKPGLDELHQGTIAIARRVTQ